MSDHHTSDSAAAPKIIALRPVTADAEPPARRPADEFWRSVEEFEGDPAFQEAVRREYPSQTEMIVDPVQRRTFLKLMGASLALGGFTACTKQPPETIVPYVRQPEELIPGRPLFFATAMPLGGSALGLLVESHEGRPTKVEGNPDHPGSLGATDVFAQAAVLDLYDPDRIPTLSYRGDIRPWAAFIAGMRAAAAAQQPLQGTGIRILTESVASPTLAAQIRDVLARFPQARWHQWDPASRENVRAGAKAAFGEYVDAQYRLDKADVILTLDADLFASGPASVRHGRDFATRRRPDPGARMNRLYAVESMPTLTGSRADHRLAARAGDIEAIARAIAAGVGVTGASGSGNAGIAAENTRRWTDAVAKDLAAHRGAALVVAGDTQPPAVHALAHAMNQALGSVGSTVVYTSPVEAEPVNQLESLRSLVDDMNAGKVDLLLVLGANPVYTAPADINFAAALTKVQTRVALAHLVDETAALCDWVVPQAHFLESWSDARAFDGTVSIVQPLIAPLYGGRSGHEVIATLTDRPERSGYEIVREYWNSQFRNGSVSPDLAPRFPQSTAPTAPPGAQATAASATQPAGTAPASALQGATAVPALTPEFESAWRRWLNDGVIRGTALPTRTVTVRPEALGAGQTPPSGGTEIVFCNDPTILDGRFANNGWMQELPKPITRLTWDNAVLMSQATAEKFNISGRPSIQGGEHGQIFSDIVELKYRGRTVRGAAFVVVGHPDDAVTVHLGYGRKRGGRIGTGPGFNANAIRTSDAMSIARGVEIVNTHDRYSLACVQAHHLMEGRGLVRAVTLEEFTKDPNSIREGDETPPLTDTLYPDYDYSQGYKWGMSIDVNACIGCNACVVGCQSENNIPVVGKDEVMRGREMHWLRIDTYYRGDLANPETYFQPVPCMQCENAPCELVCPVGATVHSAEGLNDMVYNRCVGTRYCSNNCPYKVRRFNFLLYQDWDTPSLKLGRNPDVSVRSRGVMEKCTYCVQRINEAKIDSERENRSVRDGEIKTACQAVCPADAIVFGNLNDPNSRVAKLKAQQRNYALLGELNTRPRTTYLGVVRNSNPELTGGEGARRG